VRATLLLGMAGLAVNLSRQALTWTAPTRSPEVVGLMRRGAHLLKISNSEASTVPTAVLVTKTCFKGVALCRLAVQRRQQLEESEAVRTPGESRIHRHRRGVSDADRLRSIDERLTKLSAELEQVKHKKEVLAKMRDALAGRRGHHTLQNRTQRPEYD